MKDYNIRFAEYDDIPRIMNFIDENWKKNHILSKDRRLFEWQYINNDKVNMVIGVDAEGLIQGILGYIPYCKWDSKDISLALWKAKQGTSFLGVRLLMFLINEEPHRNIFCNGINLGTTESIYRKTGMKIGKLSQYYRLCDRDEYKIAKVIDKKIPILGAVGNAELKKVDTFEELIGNSTDKMFGVGNVPYKSKEYIAKRYFDHPSYKYFVYSVYEAGKKSDVALVFRVQECNFSCALRLIDMIGDYLKIADVSQCIDELANDFGAEYIDMYEFGIDDSVLINAGWLKVGDDENIIPNYFAPYLQSNVEINICTSNEKIVLFKGDGDQDRPN